MLKIAVRPLLDVANRAVSFPVRKNTVDYGPGRNDGGYQPERKVFPQSDVLRCIERCAAPHPHDKFYVVRKSIRCFFKMVPVEHTDNAYACRLPRKKGLCSFPCGGCGDDDMARPTGTFIQQQAVSVYDFHFTCWTEAVSTGPGAPQFCHRSPPRVTYPVCCGPLAEPGGLD